MIYILNSHGHPLMPTENHAKIRVLLKQGMAKVIKRCPFTVQLLHKTTNFVQDLTLGVDAGSKKVGVSVTNETTEFYSAVVELRTDIVGLLSERRQYRREKRNRLRYRKPRFNNRTASKKEGWVAPSIESKIKTHLRVVDDFMKILPVSKLVVETASFDIQKILNPEIRGTEYQEGETLGFWNIREYVLFRDGHTCQCCKGKSKDKILNVHHIESRQIGGNAPNNLITLCETCHTAYHQGKVKLPKEIKRNHSFRDAAFMGIMRWAFYNRLKEKYPNVYMTYGYITKNTRIKNNLPKEHYIDARCITGNPTAKPLGITYFQKKVRCHNRQIHKAKILKGNVKKRNQAPYEVKGFRLFDKVRFQNKECFIFGRRTSGSFDIRKLNGEKIHAGISYKKLQLLEKRKTILTEIQMQL